jgi:hypothetical protein
MMPIITETSNPISVLNRAWSHAHQSLFEVDDTVDIAAQGKLVSQLYEIFDAAKHLVDAEERMQRILKELRKSR